MKFNYKWTLKDSAFTKDKGTVFSTFSGGGGSSMGYLLAGYNIIGCNEIDKRMMNCYKSNLPKCKYYYLESITKLVKRKNLPLELFNLDILDGSPPCSSFTNAGKRSKHWGVQKKFLEGQEEQVLDTLFFEFIKLAKKLQPKVVITENVPGITFGEALKYVQNIYIEFEKAGYDLHHWILDASKMGVPQKRKRIFFIGMRKDLSNNFNKKIGLINNLPFLDLTFNEKKILLKEIINQPNDEYVQLTDYIKKRWNKTKVGKYLTKFQSGYNKVSLNQVCPVISSGCYPLFHPHEQRSLGKKEVFLIHSFPIDYNTLDFKKYHYIPVMSVPPVMMAQIANRIYNQWLQYLK